MIAKQVRTTSAVKSEFARLANYLIDEQGKLQRVGEVRVTNCYSDDAQAAVLEVLNTQAYNHRAGPNRTYHLIISFRPGEEVDRETLALIEGRVCTALGFSDHQRLSVVHHDTDNLHVHIAINKIHPTRHTIHDPYRDYHTLARVCEKIEADYRLERDNHQAKKFGAENRAADMEAHAGVESLLGWIRRECGEQIRGATTWGELHEVLRDHGLELRERANGLVFADTSGVTVKASAVDRGFSQPKLEARLGQFQARAEGGERRPPSKAYEKKPLRCGVDTIDLYARYKSEQAENSHARAVADSKARERKSRLIETAKLHGRLRRSVIQLMEAPRIGKKVMFRAASTTLVGQIEAINRAYLKERQSNYDKHRRRAWADWLRVEASAGDEEALQVLRARGARRAVKGNSFCGEHDPTRSAHVARPDGVSKKGTLIYNCGATAVRDDGDRLAVSRSADQEGLRAALAIAQERYGARIAVRGSDSFREKIALAAAAGKLDITFDDKELELRRQAIVRASGAHARAETHRQRDTTGAVLHRPAAVGSGKGFSLDEGLTIGASVAPYAAIQALADPRRGALAAAKYVHEREHRRCTTFDIAKHTLYTSADRSSVVYGGVRVVDGQALALLLQNGEVKVMPVNDTSAQRLGNLKIGTAIDVTPDGIVKMKGRSR